MEVKEKILALLSMPDYTPLKATELFEVVEAQIKEEFADAVRELMAEGAIVELKNARLCLPKDADLVVGRIHFRQSGTALVFPEGIEKSDAIGIPAEETGVAMHGDQVLIRLIPAGGSKRYRMGPRGRAVFDDKETLGKVIRVLRRAHTKLTGTLEKDKNIYNVVADDPRIIRNILVGDPASSNVKPTPTVGDKVVVELDEWKQKHLNPQGRITEVLGRSHEPLTEHAALFVQYDLAEKFADSVEAEAKAVGVPVNDTQRAGRLDLRKHNVFTIDPDDAKDFDDALHLERLSDGSVKIGIHIADVSGYVRPNGELDQEAQKRGNSTYLVGEVVPMLPHVLSSGVCSLKEAEDRLTKSVIVTFNPQGEVVKTEFANTLIRSVKRLTYKQAKIFLDEDDFEKIRQVPPPPSFQTGFCGKSLKELSNDEMRVLQSSIRQMWSIAKRLRAARMSAGSLDLDMPEAKIYLDAQGYPARIEKVEHDESHQLVEEFMLLANQSVAKVLTRQNLPCIYRVHDKPDAKKLDELTDTLQTMGIRVGDLNLQREVAKFLEMCRSHPKGVYLKGLFLRSMRQACYRASPDGHFGLAMQDYTHFTSPIRRYADFLVHRIFDAYLYRAGLPTAPKEAPMLYNVAKLQQIAEHISLTEQNSTEAERQSVKNRLLEYFELESKKSPKTEFDAVITDVKNHGLFVEMTQSLAWGFVHISTLQSDFYVLSDDGQSLVGRRTQKRFTIGDIIKVEVAKVDRFKRQMDFALVRKDGKTVPPIPGQRMPREQQGQARRPGQQQNRRGGKKRSNPQAPQVRGPFKKGKKRR